MKIVPVLRSCAMVLCLAACGESGGPAISSMESASKPAVAAEPAKPAGPRIGLLMKTLANPFFVEMEKGARRAEKDLGVTLVVKTSAQETSVGQQIDLVNDLIAQKVAAIVIAPSDSFALVAPLKKAADAGIKIVNIDNRLDPKEVEKAALLPIPFVSVDNFAGAYKAGKALADSVSTPAMAGIIEGIRSADNARLRMEGAKKALSESKHVTVVASETANWKIEDAYTVTQQMMARQPKIRLLFAANDMMALGAIRYLRETGRKDVLVAGYDANGQALEEIQGGHMLATVDQQAAEQGYQGIALALKLIRGETVAPITLIDTKLISSNSK
ncbi:substrate-binding domain-containing protein [Rhodoferax aquaticus]|uniref:Sugar ABC transporter substrate-binding protein n=1 Tax=Rhodoferax aquaticus TaxID=2527691 RepID=A0A515EJD5_9BURK|nr:substrate-binding domain-containing protein [Rhodoferax aquaticus]QDL52796.1 sugar ABC transporter substrate-binding protein [Rhodoferax aquaticus]